MLIAKVLRLQLESRGFVVKNVVSATEAIKESCDWNPDLIIMDVYLKNKSNGIAAGIEIRNKGVNTPIIYTTGNSYQSTLKEMEPISNTQLVSKPVEFGYLMALIQNWPKP